MSTGDMVRPGVFMHIYLQAKLQARYSRSDRNVKSDLSQAGFNLDLIRTNLRNMTKLVRNLQWKRSQSAWSDYANRNSYSDADRDQKMSFVRDIVQEKRRSMVWDIGCNTGTFSRLAAANSDYVLAMDSDHLSVDLLYRSLSAEAVRNILPLVVNIADPSPRLGWRLLERKALSDRGTPDLVLCLALIHHVVIGANVPMTEFIQWLVELGGDIVIEFVTKGDDMVKGLLRNKPDVYDDYDEGRFEATLSRHCEILRRQALPSGTRAIYFATPRR